MNRRKGVPCGCGADPCGCSPKNHCVKAINNVSPDPNGDFAIEAGQNVTITETEYGIEISATGGSAEDAVKSVNGELPDQNGDVTVDTGVMTVNGVSPDADGEVTITAGSNITITPDAGTNSIEISAEGGSPEAVAPIYIDGDGKIAIKGWTLVSDKNWLRYAPSRIALTDMYLVCYNGSTDYLFGETFIPKGSNINGFRLDLETLTTGSVNIKVTCIDVYNIINDNASISNVIVASVNVYTTGSGIDERMVASTTTNYRAFNKIFTETGMGIKLYVREVL